MAAKELPRISKSKFTKGLQCAKQLWWFVHEPDAPELEPDESQQRVFDRGTNVGEVARSYVPGGVLIRDAAGELVGSCGMSGDTSDNDEAALVAAIEAAGLVADCG